MKQNIKNAIISLMLTPLMAIALILTTGIIAFILAFITALIIILPILTLFGLVDIDGLEDLEEKDNEQK